MKNIIKNGVVFLIFILTAVFLIGGWFWLFKIYPEQQQKQQAVKYDCLAQTTKDNYQELLSRVDKLFQNAAGKEIVLPGITRQDLAQVLGRRYLDCRRKIEPNETEEGRAEKTAILNQVADNETAGFEKNYKNAFADYLRDIDKSFLYLAADGDTSVFCPTGMPEVCRNETSKNMITEKDAWCSLDICRIIDNHQQDKDAAEKEVFNFQHAAGSSDFIWRLALAMRWGGLDLADKICDKISADQNQCRLEVLRFESFKMDCQETQRKLGQLVCGLGIE